MSQVSDVTQKDVPEVLQWLEPRLPVLAERLKQSQADGRLRVKAHEPGTQIRIEDCSWESAL